MNNTKSSRNRSSSVEANVETIMKKPKKYNRQNSNFNSRSQNNMRRNNVVSTNTVPGKSDQGRLDLDDIISNESFGNTATKSNNRTDLNRSDLSMDLTVDGNKSKTRGSRKSYGVSDHTVPSQLMKNKEDCDVIKKVNVKDAFIKNPDQDKIDKFSRKEGLIIIKENKKSVEKYHRFFAEGRIFCRFDGQTKPEGMDNKPIWAICTREIAQITKNKESGIKSFRITLDTGNKIDFYDSETSDITEWPDALKYLSEYYNKKKPEKFEIASYLSEKQYRIHSQVMLEIMKQQDVENYGDFLKKYDYRPILEIKAMNRYFQKIGYENLEDRMVFCEIKKCSAQEVEEEDIDAEEQRNGGCPVLKTGNKILLPKAGSLSKQKFAIQITNKDVKFDDKDNEILKAAKLPHWMEFDTMYIFTQNHDEDSSGFEQKIRTHEMLLIEEFNDEVLSKKGYAFKVEMANKVLFFDCPSALHCWKWVNMLRKSKKTAEELNRTKNKELLRNVDQVVYYYENNSLDIYSWVSSEIVKCFTKCDIYKVNMPDFLKIYDEALDELDFICDSLQAQRPFYNNLLKAFMKNFHIESLKYSVVIWNRRHKDFGGDEVVRFIQLIYKQQEIIESYGMKEPRFDNSINELSSAFQIKIYKNVMPMIQTIIDGMRKTYEEENQMYMSKGPNSFFKIINQVWDNYLLCKKELVYRNVLSQIQKLIYNFIVEYTTLVDKEDMEINIWVAIINSSLRFISLLKDFTALASKKSKIPIDKIQKDLNYYHLLKKFAQVNNQAFIKFKSKLDTCMNVIFNSVKDYKTLEQDELTNQVFDMQEIFEKHLTKVLVKKVWKFIFSQYVFQFSTMVIELSLKYKTNEVEKLSQKAKQDVKLIKGIFQNMVRKKDFEHGCQCLDALAQVWQASVEEIVAHVTTLRLHLLNDFDIDNIKDILRQRVDIDQEHIDSMMQVIKQSDQDINDKKKKLFGQVDVIYQTMRTEALVSEFVNKLKKKIIQKKEYLKKFEKTKAQEEYLKVHTDEHVGIELNCINNTSELTYTIIKISKQRQNEDTIKSFRQLIKNGVKFDKDIFYISENCLQWKNSIDDKHVEGRIFLSGISDIQVYCPKKSPQKFLIFVIGKMMYAFTFTDENELRIWGKTIQYHKEQAQANFLPTQFEQFISCTEDQIYDEIFEGEVQDYSYKGIKILCEAKRVEREKKRAYEKEHGKGTSVLQGTDVRSESDLSDSDDENESVISKTSNKTAKTNRSFKEVLTNTKQKWKEKKDQIKSHPKYQKFLHSVKIFLGLNTNKANKTNDKEIDK